MITDGKSLLAVAGIGSVVCAGFYLLVRVKKGIAVWWLRGELKRQNLKLIQWRARLAGFRSSVVVVEFECIDENTNMKSGTAEICGLQTDIYWPEK